MTRLRYAALAAALVLASVGCEKRLDEAQIRAKVLAEEAAKAADARVAKLEQELTDLKNAKTDAKVAEKDKDSVDQAKADQKKALERQLAEQKKKAEARKQEALKLAEAKTAPPAPSTAATAPKPVVVEVPAGTAISVNLGATLSTEKDKAGDLWQGTLAESVVADGQTVWAAGTPVRGVVSQSVPAGRLASGKGALGIRLTEIGSSDVDGGDYLVTGGKTGERNAKIIGGAAALGALIGVLSDKRNKDDHALGGAAIGAAAGTAAAAATAKTTILIPADKAITFSLAAPEKVTLKKP
ncbi:MAG: hypothetical protein IPL96_14790 [Holophagaceae bacterium]|nr:hypothetical protein [Holophagaceae bacterium]